MSRGFRCQSMVVTRLREPPCKRNPWQRIALPAGKPPPAGACYLTAPGGRSWYNAALQNDVGAGDGHDDDT
jgi:hypothetical protein